MVIFLICVFHLLCVDFCDVLEGRLDMNEFPVVSSLCLCKYFWDYHGANIATRWKEMFDERLFRGPKEQFWREIQKLIWVMLILGKPKF